jgi:hypothetical protein
MYGTLPHGTLGKLLVEMEYVEPAPSSSFNWWFALASLFGTFRCIDPSQTNTCHIQIRKLVSITLLVPHNSLNDLSSMKTLLHYNYMNRNNKGYTAFVVKV